MKTKEYDLRCHQCHTSVRTTDPPGSTCDCGRMQRDWMVQNRDQLAFRATKRDSEVIEITDGS